MPRDPARVADTRAWLQKADNDLRAAQHDRTAEPPLLGDVTFHSQQTAEKTFKALLTWHDKPFRKTHNLEELGEACLAFDPSLKAVVDRAVPLTQYAWRFRYPGEPGEPTPSEAEEALAIARYVLQSVRARLPGDVTG